MIEPCLDPSEHDDRALIEWLDELNDDGLFFVKRGTKRTRSHSNSDFPSLEIFLAFVEILEEPRAAGGLQVDASGILSRACFETWVSTRRTRPARPEEAFRKCLLAHVTTSDHASLPFPPAVEKALLVLLRRPGVWPCFDGYRGLTSRREVRIGSKGVRW